MITKTKKHIKVISTYMAVLTATILYTTTARAAGEDVPVIVSGTLELLNDAKGWIMLLTLAITVVLALIKGIMWQKADEQEKPAAKKSFTHVIILGVVILCVEGIITLVFSYYT